MKTGGHIIRFFISVLGVLFFAACSGSGSSGFDAGSGSSGFDAEQNIFLKLSKKVACEGLDGTTFCSPIALDDTDPSDDPSFSMKIMGPVTDGSVP